MFTVYGHEQCRYCKQAIALLNHKGFDVTYLDVKAEGNEEHLAFLKEQGFSTVPQIYDHDHYVGGFEDLRTYLNR